LILKECLHEAGDSVAWSEIKAAQKFGKAPPAEFIEALRRKMGGNSAK